MSENSRELRLEQFGHRFPMAVRWGDIDLLGHVNNAKYFTYEESSRIEYFQRLAEQDARMWKDYGLILASIGADFLSQVHYPAQLEIGTRVVKIGRSSLSTISGLFQNGQPVAAVRAALVWFDYLNQKPIAVPESVRAWIRAREVIAPQE